MPHRPPKKRKKTDTQPGDPQSALAKASQLAQQRQQEMATRSHLSRFQNRSSERK